MRTLLNVLAGLALIAVVGCAESTTRKDVAAARDNLDREKQQTADTIHEGQRDIAQAQHDAQNYTAAKPVVTDPVAPADAQRVADARDNAAEKIAKQKEQERAAAANVADKEQALQATQAKDAYVKNVENKLADTDKQIDILKDRASKAQGTDKDTLDRQVSTMKTQRDLAQKALNDLKSADLANWKNHQQHVRLALQDLDNSSRTVR